MESSLQSRHFRGSYGRLSAMYMIWINAPFESSKSVSEASDHGFAMGLPELPVMLSAAYEENGGNCLTWYRYWARHRVTRTRACRCRDSPT